MRNSILATMVAAAALIPMAAQAAPVSVFSMSVTGKVSDMDFWDGQIETGPPDYNYTSFSIDPGQTSAYYGVSGGLFTTDIGEAVDGIITIFEDSDTSERSLSCVFAQYSFDLCTGGGIFGETTDADGNTVVFSGDGSSDNRIVYDNSMVSMRHRNDGFYNGQTSDGLLWFSHGLMVSWNLTIESTSSGGTDAGGNGTSVVVTPLPSSALLLLTPLAFAGWRQRRSMRL